MWYMSQRSVCLYTYIHDFEYTTLLIINKEETARFVLKRLGNMKRF